MLSNKSKVLTQISNTCNDKLLGNKLHNTGMIGFIYSSPHLSEKKKRKLHFRVAEYHFPSKLEVQSQINFF